MNNRNTHMRYRRSIYRRNRIKSTLIISAVCIVIVFLLFLIIGNILKDRTDTLHEQTYSSAIQSSIPHTEVKAVNAFPIALSDKSSTLSSRVNAARTAGYKDICFALDSADGTLLYSSSVAQRLGKQASGSGLWTLTRVSEIFRNSGMYSVGITNINDFSSEDDLTRTAAIGYHASIIAEALRSGIDEVMIFIGELPHERYSELMTLANEVHRLCPEGTLGLSLSPTLFTGDNDTLLAEIWGAFDYIAVDITTPPDEQTDIVSYADSSLGGMLYYLLRYNMRVLIPNTTDNNVATSLISAIKAKGTQNIQIMPQ